MGKPNLNEGGQQQHPVSPHSTDGTNTQSNRNSRITAPQPVDPDKDRELLHQKVHMTRVMLEQAREDFLKQQKQYVRTPSEKLHTQLLDKERTVKTLENQLRALTGGEEPATQMSQKCSDLDQNTMDSATNSWWKSSCSSVSHRPWDSSLMHTLQVPQVTSKAGAEPAC